MKRILPLAALVAALITITGCATTGGKPTITADQIIATADVIVPMDVALYLKSNPNSVGYFAAAADVLDKASLGTNTSPQQLIADLDKLGGGSAAEVIAINVIGLYTGFFAQSVTPSGSDQQRVIAAIAADIRKGLPPDALGKFLRAKKHHKLLFF